MKIKLPLIVFLVMLFFTATVYAEPLSLGDHKLTVQFPENYSVITPGTINKNTELIESMGHSNASFKKHMNDANMLAVAATENNDRQYQLKSWKTDFSNEVKKLTTLDSESAVTAIKTMLAGTPEESIVGWNYIDTSKVPCYEIIIKEKGFSYIQYVTIQNGSFYALVFYNNTSEVISDADLYEAKGVYSTFTIEEDKPLFSLLDSNTVIQIIITAALVIAAALIAIILLVSLFGDLLRRRRENDVSDYVKIKRRKFK